MKAYQLTILLCLFFGGMLVQSCMESVAAKKEMNALSFKHAGHEYLNFGRNSVHDPNCQMQDFVRIQDSLAAVRDSVRKASTPQ